jgi:Zn-dependent metalloprotease
VSRLERTAPASGSLVDQLQSRVSQRNTTLDAGEALRGESPAPVVPETEQAPSELHPAFDNTLLQAARPRARVLDASTNNELGTVDTLDAAQPAAAAARNVQRGLDYYATTFGRNGLDNAGSGVDVLVDDRSLRDDGKERFKGNGGYYSMPDAAGVTTEAIHFGTGDSYDARNGRVDQREMYHADDLAIHELTHGIIRSATGHLGGDADEAGATNEGIADVMAASATRDWKIGEGMYTDHSDYRMMRDIANPDDPSAIHGLWTNTSQVDAARAAGDEVEEHWASGLVSTAAYRVQQRIGGEAGWNAVERVFYDTIDRNRLGDMSFDAVAGALRTSATALYGDGSVQATAFDQELARGGM